MVGRVAVGVRAGGHPLGTGRVGRAHQLDRGAGVVEQLVGPVGLQPLVQHLQVLRVALHPAQGHLVRPPRVHDLDAIDHRGSGPPLGAAQHDHGPAGLTFLAAAAAGVGLDLADPVHRTLECLGEPVVHTGQIGALDLDDLVPVALEQLAQILGILSGQHGGSGDLVSVQMQDGQHRPVAFRVQERDSLPRPLQRTGLGLAVAHHSQADQVGVVVGSAERVRQDIAEFATLVDRARRGDADVTGDAARRAEPATQGPHPGSVLRGVGVGLRPRAFQPGRRSQRGAPMARTCEVHDVQIPLPDQPRHVRIDERQTGRRAPMPQQPGLDVVAAQRLSQQHVVLQVDLRHRQEHVGAPPGVDAGELVVGQELVGHRSPPGQRQSCHIGAAPPIGFTRPRVPVTGPGAQPVPLPTPLRSGCIG